MRVLSVDDLGVQHQGGRLFMATCSRRNSSPRATPVGALRALGLTGIR